MHRTELDDEERTRRGPAASAAEKRTRSERSASEPRFDRSGRTCSNEVRRSRGVFR